MDIIHNLTNEEISKRFSNQFDLVNYAIGLASSMIQTGRSPRVKMSTENPALLILEEIAEGKDTFEETISSKESFEEEIELIEVSSEGSLLSEKEEALSD